MTKRSIDQLPEAHILLHLPLIFKSCFMAAIDVHPSVKAIRTTQIGIAISIILVILKGAAGYFGNSYALIADATETGADFFSSTLLWIALRIAVKPADTSHPYGHGKAEPIASIIISFFLMAAAFWIAYHAYEYIRTPHDMPKRFTLYVLMVVIIVKESMFRYVFKVGVQINSNAVKADAQHHRSDVITSVAAFIGILVALIAGKGYEGADDWAALLASGIVFYNAIQLLRPGLAEIMDAAPSEDVVEKVRELASQVHEVKFIEKCFVRKMGFDYFVDMHIQLDPNLTVAEGHSIAHLVKNKLLESHLSIKDVLVHIEPFDGKIIIN